MNDRQQASAATLSAVLARSAERAPEGLALLGVRQTPLRYGELAQLVVRSVRELNELGVGRGDRVASVMQPGPESAMALLAITAGATCSPLNPTYREKELEYFLTDMNAKAVLVQAGVESPVRAVAKQLGVAVIEATPLPHGAAGAFTLVGERAPSPSRPGPAEPDDVALILHTSGTTSRPKGVPLTHRNVTISAGNLAEWLRLGPEDRCLGVMPPFHVHGIIATLFATIHAGGSFVAPPGFQAPRVFEWFDTFEPTWYSAVPAIHQAIYERAAANRDIIARRPLRVIRSASAPLSVRLLHDLEATFNAPVIESYGMTEASTCIASNPMPPRARKPGSVGVPTGTEVGVMGDDGKLLAANTQGELVLRGPTVTSGYDNNPAANEGAFKNGWFRTGDLGIIDADGYVFIQGRLKEIINRGGEKVSPREVDELLATHPAVLQAVTFPVPDKTVGEEIGSCVVLRAGAKAEERELIAFVAATLSAHKVPRYLKIVDKVPTSATGKVQRSQLAGKLGLGGQDSKPAEEAAPRDFEAPAGETEKAIAGFWADVLRTQVGRNDDFFAAGGSSVLAAMILARVRDVLGVNLGIHVFFEAPTVAAMAARVEAAKVRTDDRRVTKASRETGLPLSFVQEGIWFVWRMNSESAVYNSPVAVRLQGPLDVAVMRRALDEIVARHEVARSVFPNRDGKLMQIVRPAGPAAFELVDLRHNEDPEAALEDHLLDESCRPFDLENGPVFRATLIQVADDDHVMLIVMHHIVSDAWAKELVLSELAALYSAFREGRAAPLPALPIQYGDVAAWQRSSSESAFAEQLAYWKDRLAGAAPALDLPTDHPRPPMRRFEGATQTFSIEGEVLAGLRRLCRIEATTPFMTLLGAYQALIAHHAKRTDVLIGSPVSNRSRVEFEPLLGCFINMVVFRTDLSNDPTFAEILARVREVAVSAYSRRDLPFEQLVHAIAPPRDPSRSPIFQQAFIYHDTPAARVQLPGVSVDRLDIDTGSAKYDLSLIIDEDQDALRGTVEYDIALFEDATIERLIADFERLLARAVANPTTRLSALLG